MFLFLCSFYIAFWGCLDLFYLRFIKNFQIIREEFSFFFTVFHNAFDLLGCGYSTEPGRQALTGSGSSRCGSIYLLVALPTAIAVGSLWACLLFVYALPGLRRVRSVRVCYSFTLSPRLLPWARSGLAQHHIECHHEAEAHHKCYGGAV